MAKPLNPDTALQRAQETVDEKITAIRTAIDTQATLQHVETDAARRREELERELTTQLDTTRRQARQAYIHAISKGWTRKELEKIGLTDPRPKNRKPARTKTVSANQTPSPDQDTPE